MVAIQKKSELNGDALLGYDDPSSLEVLQEEAGLLGMDRDDDLRVNGLDEPEDVPSPHVARGMEPLSLRPHLARRDVRKPEDLHVEMVQPLLPPLDIDLLLLVERLAGRIDVAPPLGIDVYELGEVPEAEAQDEGPGVPGDVLLRHAAGLVGRVDDLLPSFFARPILAIDPQSIPREGVSDLRDKGGKGVNQVGVLGRDDQAAPALPGDPVEREKSLQVPGAEIGNHEALGL